MESKTKEGKKEIEKELNDAIKELHLTTIKTIILSMLVIFGLFIAVRNFGILNNYPILREIFNTLIFGFIVTIFASISYSLFLKKITDAQFRYIMRTMSSTVEKTISTAMGDIKNRIAEIDHDHVDTMTVNKRYLGVNSVNYRLTRDDLSAAIKAAQGQIAIANVWIPDLDSYSTDILNALNRGVSVRIMIAEPMGEVQKMRQEALNVSRIGTYLPVDAYIGDNLEVIKNIRNNMDPSGSLSLKLFKFLPAGAIYITDNSIRFCAYWGSKKAIDGPSLLIEGGEMHGELMEEFEKWWSLSNDVLDTLDHWEMLSKRPDN